MIVSFSTVFEKWHFENSSLNYRIVILLDYALLMKYKNMSKQTKTSVYPSIVCDYREWVGVLEPIPAIIGQRHKQKHYRQILTFAHKNGIKSVIQWRTLPNLLCLSPWYTNPFLKPILTPNPLWAESTGHLLHHIPKVIPQTISQHPFLNQAFHKTTTCSYVGCARIHHQRLLSKVRKVRKIFQWHVFPWWLWEVQALWKPSKLVSVWVLQGFCWAPFFLLKRYLLPYCCILKALNNV